MKNALSHDLTRTVLAVLFIGGLIAAATWVVRPFLLSFIWATMIVIATWPLMRATQVKLWGRRGLAVTLMTAALLLILVVPFSFAVVTIVDNSDRFVALSKSLATFEIPPPPDWLERLPIVGSKLTEKWRTISADGSEGLSAQLAPYAGHVVKWFVAQAGSVGMMVLQFLLTVIISAILYAKGETAAHGILRFARRLAGARGEESARLAAQAVRAVALGVVVTALVQSTLGGIALAVCGIPYAGVLTAVMFMLCVAQLGPGLVLIPSVIWLYWKGDPLWGTVLLVCTLIVGTLDNFLRPILIRKGADLPLLLIFAGVIGGLIAFGIIGLFIGPVVLSVSYTLLVAWVDEERPDATSPPLS